mgnify:FL=1
MAYKLSLQEMRFIRNNLNCTIAELQRISGIPYHVLQTYYNHCKGEVPVRLGSRKDFVYNSLFSEVKAKFTRAKCVVSNIDWTNYDPALIRHNYKSTNR